MGKWVILIGDKDFTLSQFDHMTFSGNIGISRLEYSLTVKYEDGSACFLADENGLIISDYDPEEIKQLPFDEPVMVMLQYSNVDVLKRIIDYHDFPNNCLIDCDGVTLGIDSTSLWEYLRSHN